ncbi:MAG: glycosyltransferase [Firmicutes bacterium]|nr:glycosyltransferase [Bacillota bacterium]
MHPTAPISAVVPARNEADNLERVVRSLARQPEIAEILVVNDQSTDRSGEVLARLAAEIRQLRVLETTELPAGWVGKNYAASLGAAAARGDWLLFTDADTEHLPGAAARALEQAQRSGAALVSYSPEQQTPTWWEQALIPFLYCRLAQLYSFAEVSDPDSSVAAANGQFLLIRRDVYEQIGGHAAVSGELLEDVALAERVKRAGHRLWFAPGAGVVRTRMYTNFAAMWQGWTKNLLPLLGRRSVAVELAVVVPWVPLALLGLGGLHPAFFVLGLVLLAGRHAAYAALLRRNRCPVHPVVYYLVAVLLYAAVLLNSARRYAQGRVVWKGREYPVEVP